MSSPAFFQTGRWGTALLLTTLVGVAHAGTTATLQNDPGRFARGAKAWADNCASCHNLRPARDLRDDQWRVVIAHMRVRADLTGQEAQDILRFLQETN